VLRSLKALHTLELCGTFTDTDLKALKEFTGLRTLRLHQTAITDDGLKALKEIKTLRSLTIDGHWDLDGPRPMLFAVVPAKPADANPLWLLPTHTSVPGEGVSIALSPPRFTAKGLKYLAEMTNLIELNVAHNKLTDADMTILGKITGLKKLGVFAPEVTDRGIAAFKDLKKLETIDLRGTQITPAAGPTLRALPQLKLFRSNLLQQDPNYKTRMAEWRKALPARITIRPLMNHAVSAIPGGFLPPFGGMGGGALGIGGGALGVLGGNR
jgi:hypothetical protein